MTVFSDPKFPSLETVEIGSANPHTLGSDLPPHLAGCWQVRWSARPREVISVSRVGLGGLVYERTALPLPQAPAPVLVAPAPVHVPAPVLVAPAPVLVAPAPVQADQNPDVAPPPEEDFDVDSFFL